MYQAGDLVKRKGTIYDGRVESYDLQGRAVLVRSDGALYELAPGEVELLARNHPCSKTEAHPKGEACAELVTPAGAAAGHTVPYKSCAKCHPGQPNTTNRPPSPTTAHDKPTDSGRVGDPGDLGGSFPPSRRHHAGRPADDGGAAAFQRAYLTQEHSAAGPCPACEWSYCRVRKDALEPEARCVACSDPRMTLNGVGDPIGGGCFDYPLRPDAEREAEHPDAPAEEKLLCPACAQKVAEFIDHLRDTHGGRR